MEFFFLLLKVTEGFDRIRIQIRLSQVLYRSEDPDPHPDPYQNVTDPEHWCWHSLSFRSDRPAWIWIALRPTRMILIPRSPTRMIRIERRPTRMIWIARVTRRCFSASRAHARAAVEQRRAGGGERSGRHHNTSRHWREQCGSFAPRFGCESAFHINKTRQNLGGSVRFFIQSRLSVFFLCRKFFLKINDLLQLTTLILKK